MRKFLGKSLQLLGWLCAGWFGVTGSMFSGVYLMGFIGTGGREAGGELVLALGVTLGGVLVGLLVAKLGGWIASYDSRFEA